MPRAALILLLLAMACSPAERGATDHQQGARLVTTSPWWFSEDTSLSKVDGRPHILNSHVTAFVSTSPTTVGDDTTSTGLAWFSCGYMRPQLTISLPQGITGTPRLRIGKSGPVSFDAAGLRVTGEFIVSEFGQSALPLTLADTIWIEFTPTEASVPWTAVLPMDGAHALVARLQQERCDVLDS